jgi:choline-sulfatase
LARPFRYTFILGLVALGTALAAVGGWRFARASAPVSGPIILISIDTLRADHLPAYGYRKLQTPTIDALAADGVVFERAYSHAPQTLPAHASLLSGRLPFETGVRDDAGFVVKPGERLLAEILSDRGYSTGAVVSSYSLRKETGLAQGFAFFDGNMPERAPDAAWEPVKREGADSAAIAERWLESAGTTRAFLFLHLADPHRPYSPSDRFAQFSPYDAAIVAADEVLGRFVKFLKTHQLYDQSTIILVSDHGEGLGDHGEQEHGLLVYDEVLRVPLIIKQAANESAGRRVADPVQHIDLVPTILDLAKAPVPGNLHGRSLNALLDGTGRLQERTIYSESLYGRFRFGWAGLTSVTDGRYRYIKAPREELYDLKQDPAERTNLAERDAETTTRLRQALDRLTSGTAVVAPRDISPEEYQRLAALGDAGPVTSQPAESAGELPDPKDNVGVLETYRTAHDRAMDRQWPQAIDLLQSIVREQPELAGVWADLATVRFRMGRYEQAVDAYQELLALEPGRPSAHLDISTALLRLRRLDQAAQHAELAFSSGGASVTVQTHANAHELLARIALARGDRDLARSEAEIAKKTSPGLPFYVEGRLLYDAGKFEDALPEFERAIDAIKDSDGTQIADLHFHAGDTLLRLERRADAEDQFLLELQHFPQDIRTRAALAGSYQAAGRREEAGEVLTALIQVTPTPEAYSTAARLWASQGNARKAASLRAEARQRFAAPPTAARTARR